MTADPSGRFVQGTRGSNMHRNLTVLATALAMGGYAVSAPAHPPQGCRTTLAQFKEHREAFETSAAVAGPILDRLSAAYEEVAATDSHARRHAVLYRHFVTDYPLLQLHLSEMMISTSDAMSASARAIFCLTREKGSPG